MYDKAIKVVSFTIITIWTVQHFSMYGHNKRITNYLTDFNFSSRVNFEIFTVVFWNVMLHQRASDSQHFKRTLGTTHPTQLHIPETDLRWLYKHNSIKIECHIWLPHKFLFHKCIQNIVRLKYPKWSWIFLKRYITINMTIILGTILSFHKQLFRVAFVCEIMCFWTLSTVANIQNNATE